MEKVESADSETNNNSSSETDNVAESENVLFKAPPPKQQQSKATAEEIQVDTSKCYKPPEWAQTCPAESNYHIEVIKNGTPLPDDTIQLSGLDHCILGRQPGPLLNPSLKTGRTSALLHPSISRGHAVLQYGCNSDSSSGWYIFDLDSTHGTFVNKHRVPPGRYIRLRVGYVLRFGSSTRLLILNGPQEDMEQESKESYSELVAKRKAEMAKMERDERELKKFVQEEEEMCSRDECNWGLADDGEDEDNGENALQLLADSGNCLSHEKNYIEDPKKALKAFFDREGIDPYPEYEFVEGKFGQQICRVELPLEEGTIYAEVPLTGRKKKEAVAACALEACRMLDRLGQFDANKEGAEAVRRARERAYWQENDYYSSDEDTFLDRTGQIEVRRRMRMRRLGVDDASSKEDDSADKKVDEEGQDSLTLLAKLEDLGKEMIKVEDELNAAERALEAVGENASEMDELEAYMEAIKNGAPKRAERQVLKRRLLALRQEEVRLLRRAGIRSISARFSSSAPSAVSAAVRATLTASDKDASKSEVVHAESKLNTLKRQLPKMVVSERFAHKQDSKKEVEEAFVPEVDEDDETDVIKQESSKSVEGFDDEVNETESARKRPPNSRPDSDSREKKAKVDQNLEALIIPTKADHSNSSIPSKDMESTEIKDSDSLKKSPQKSPRPEVVHDKGVVENEEKTEKRLVVGPAPPPLPFVPQEVDEEPDSVRTYDENMDDPNFALWVPPQDQTGDGMTELNKKYGY
ncbi:hypothetical protein Aperf_G00000080908 [Anoplocephala perfoliata]